MDINYRNPALRQLARFAPKDRHLQQIDRAEALLGEIKDETRYPFDYLCYRVTGYRPEASSDLVLEGADARHDLRMFVEDLSRTAHQEVGQAREPVLTVEEVSGRYKVSTRTVNRWRAQGLVARRFLIGGRVKVAFLESSLARFVGEHPAQVERSGRFSLLSDAERDEIVRRARRLAAVGPVSLAEVARRVARKLGRSRETVRTTLKTYDRDHPDRALFAPPTGPMDEAAKATLCKAYLRGVPVETLAAQHRRTRSSVYRVINEMRAPSAAGRAPGGDVSRQLRRPRPGRRHLGTHPHARGRPGRPQDQGPQGPAPLPGQPLRRPPAGPRAGGPPLPEAELPEAPGPPAARRARPAQGPLGRPRRDRAAPGGGPRRQEPDHPGQPPGWSSPSPSGTSRPPTTSSS